MKRFVSAFLLTGCLLCSAGAAQVGTIDNHYPGDTEAQAQMLYDLGLFKGTDKGFELEKSMTRAEAAVMLTRLLGAEQTALRGAWKHPFADVPQWADKYVGWLYQNGLTKGVSATRYGAERAVTCAQYSIFMERATGYTDSETYTDFATKDEVQDTDAEGFVRGDAVSLSARLLEQPYFENNSTDGRSVAEKLVGDGVFTADRLKTAAWDVLPRYYFKDYQNDAAGRQIAEPFVCQIAGVTVAQCPEEKVTGLTGISTDRLVRSADSVPDCIIYRMDSKTMAATPVLTLPHDSFVQYLGRAGETDYLLVDDKRAETQSLYAVRGNTASVALENLTQAQSSEAMHTVSQCARGCIFRTDDNTAYRLTETGAERLNLSAGSCRVTEDGMILTENRMADKTVLTAYDWNGRQTDRYTIPNGYQSNDAEVAAHFAPQLFGSNGTLLWGTAGLYRAEDGHLRQVTAAPVIALQQDTDGAVYAVSCDASERLEYYAAAAAYQAGDRILRIDSDGTVTTLVTLPDTQIDELVSVKNGRVRFRAAVQASVEGLGHFTYALENGRVTVQSATDTMVYEYGADAVRNEQKRIDALLKQSD